MVVLGTSGEGGGREGCSHFDLFAGHEVMGVGAKGDHTYPDHWSVSWVCYYAIITGASPLL